MEENKITYYQIPNKDWYRIHFVRPRFKGNIENVLLYMANECCRIPKCSCEEYSKKYFNAIKMFPGNIDAKRKLLTTGEQKSLHCLDSTQKTSRMM